MSQRVLLAFDVPEGLIQNLAAKDIQRRRMAAESAG